MYGKPNIEPPSYDLPPPSYDEVMKSNKIWIIFIFEFLKRKLSFGIFVLAFALEGFKIRKTSLIGRHCLLSQLAWIAPLVVPFKPSAWAYFVFRLNIQPHPFVLSSLADLQMILTIEYFCNHFNPNIFAISGALFTLVWVNSNSIWRGRQRCQQYLGYGGYIPGRITNLTLYECVLIRIFHV